MIEVDGLADGKNPRLRHITEKRYLNRDDSSWGITLKVALVERNDCTLCRNLSEHTSSHSPVFLSIKAYRLSMSLSAATRQPSSVQGSTVAHISLKSFVLQCCLLTPGSKMPHMH